MKALMLKQIFISLVIITFAAKANGQKSNLTSLANIKLDSSKVLLQNQNLKQLKYNSLILFTPTFDANRLPLFCKWEHQLHQQSRFPVRIRLGSIDYVNKLESKH